MKKESLSLLFISPNFNKLIIMTLKLKFNKFLKIINLNFFLFLSKFYQRKYLIFEILFDYTAVGKNAKSYRVRGQCVSLSQYEQCRVKLSYEE
jgi:hypothetical protein